MWVALYIEKFDFLIWFVCQWLVPETLASEAGTQLPEFKKTLHNNSACVMWCGICAEKQLRMNSRI